MRDGEQTTAGRGYGSEHRRLRAALQVQVNAGEGWCTAPVCLFARKSGDSDGRWVPPGAADCRRGCSCPKHWDLGHLPGKQGWAGIQHAKCNRSEGGRRGNPRRTPATERREPRQPTWRPSRIW